MVTAALAASVTFSTSAGGTIESALSTALDVKRHVELPSAPAVMGDINAMLSTSMARPAALTESVPAHPGGWSSRASRPWNRPSAGTKMLAESAPSVTVTGRTTYESKYSSKAAL